MCGETAKKEPTNIALDVHAHLIPVGQEPFPFFSGVDWQDGKLTIDGHTVGLKKIFDVEALTSWMTEYSVEEAYVSLPPPVYRQELNEADSRQWFGYLNEQLLAQCELHNSKLKALPHLPLEHPQLALEIAREYGSKGIPGFALAAGGPNTPVYSADELDVVWQELNKQEAFVLIHPGGCCDGRLKAFYLSNLVGNPYETGVAVSHLIFKGIPSQHPNIKFCLVHGGGVVPMLVGRWCQGFETNRPGVDSSLETPDKAIKRFYMDCITHSADAVELTAKTIGQERIMFGSDWPFPMGFVKPTQDMAEFAEELKLAICNNRPDQKVELQ